MGSGFKSKAQREGFFSRYNDNSQISSIPDKNSTTFSQKPAIIARAKESQPNDEGKKLRDATKRKEKELEAQRNKDRYLNERSRQKEITIQLAITKKHQRILSDLINRRITPDEARKIRQTGAKSKSDEAFIISPAFVSDQ